MCSSDLALAAKHAGETVVTVTHDSTLDLVYRRANGIPLEKARDFPIPNTGICWLDISPSAPSVPSAWRIIRWADTTHLAHGALEVSADF